MTSDKKPRLNLKPLPPETDEEIYAAAEYSADDIAAAQAFVAGLRTDGEIVQGGEKKRIPAAVLRELWNAD
jgi:hypothetical protein